VLEVAQSPLKWPEKVITGELEANPKPLGK